MDWMWTLAAFSLGLLLYALLSILDEDLPQVSPDPSPLAQVNSLLRRQSVQARQMLQPAFGNTFKVPRPSQAKMPSIDRLGMQHRSSVQACAQEETGLSLRRKRPPCPDKGHCTAVLSSSVLAGHEDQRDENAIHEDWRL
eukprot:768222-Hanusia_phi.AAC.2